MSAPPTYQPGWYADPEGRYDFRYHNGQEWTNDVSRDGERLVDGVDDDPASRRHDGDIHRSDGPAGGQGHRDRRATAALTLAIIGLCLAWMPLFFIAGAVCALLGIALGLSARRRVPRDSRGFAGLSIVIGACALVVCALGIWLTMWVYDLVDAYEHPPATEVHDLACTGDSGAVTVTGTLVNVGDRRSRFRVVVDVDPADSPNHYAVPIDVDAVEPGEQADFSATRLLRNVADGELACTIRAVTGPPPLGITV